MSTNYEMQIARLVADIRYDALLAAADMLRRSARNAQTAHDHTAAAYEEQAALKIEMLAEQTKRDLTP